jgi:hypothetical protein
MPGESPGRLSSWPCGRPAPRTGPGIRFRPHWAESRTERRSDATSAPANRRRSPRTKAPAQRSPGAAGSAESARSWSRSSLCTLLIRGIVLRMRLLQRCVRVSEGVCEFATSFTAVSGHRLHPTTRVARWECRRWLLRLCWSKDVIRVRFAREYGVSRRWVITLVQRYLAGGDAGLQPHPRRPLRSPNRTAKDIEDEVI